MKKMHRLQEKIHHSESEISRHLQEAALQYEKYIQIADLADIDDQDELVIPKYSWDNPIGLVITNQ